MSQFASNTYSKFPATRSTVHVYMFAETQGN